MTNLKKNLEIVFGKENYNKIKDIPLARLIKFSPKRLQEFGVSYQTANIFASSLEIFKTGMNTGTPSEKEILDNKEKMNAYFRKQVPIIPDNETFWVLLLSPQLTAIKFKAIQIGTLDEVHVSIRDIVKLSLDYNINKVVLFHNHPSNNNEPSDSDYALTLEVANALRLFSIELLDHIIECASSYTSLSSHLQSEIDEKK